MSEQKNWRAMLENIGGWDNEFVSVPAGAVREIIEELESLRKQNEILTTVDVVAAQEASELRAKLQAAEQLIAAAKEFDESDDDAAWEPPHPIFALAEENDKLRAKLAKYEEAEKQEPEWYLVEDDSQDAFEDEIQFLSKYERVDAEYWAKRDGVTLTPLYTRPAPMPQIPDSLKGARIDKDDNIFGPNEWGQNDNWVAIIDLPGHGAAVEFYGTTKEIASERRDYVIAILTAAEEGK